MDVAMTFDPDHLVTWITDRGAGTLNSLYQTTAWYASADRENAQRLIWEMNVMGILSIDLVTRRWKAEDPLLVGLPGSEGVALLTGSADRMLAEVAARSAAKVVRHANTVDRGLTRPSTYWLSYTHGSQISDMVRHTGLRFEPDAAMRRSSTLPSIKPIKTAAPPARSGPLLELLNPRTMKFSFFDRQQRFVDGLYRMEVHAGLKRYLRCKTGEWYRTDLSEGLYLERRSSDEPLQWTSDEGKDDYALGQLAVDRRMPLPLPHARLTVLCTGLPPVNDHTRRVTIYDGVPFAVADRIAKSLYCPLKVRL